MESVSVDKREIISKEYKEDKPITPINKRTIHDYRFFDVHNYSSPLLIVIHNKLPHVNILKLIQELDGYIIMSSCSIRI